MELTIRLWSPSDARLIGSIWFDVYLKYAKTLPDLKPGARESVASWMRERARDRASIGYVAEAGESLAGFLLGRLDIWDSDPPILKPRKLLLIDTVFVAEPFRRGGVATALVGRATAHAHRAGAVGIEVTFEPENRAADALWRKLGFAARLSRASRPLEDPGAG